VDAVALLFQEISRRNGGLPEDDIGFTTLVKRIVDENPALGADLDVMRTADPEHFRARLAMRKAFQHPLVGWPEGVRGMATPLRQASKPTEAQLDEVGEKLTGASRKLVATSRSAIEAERRALRGAPRAPLAKGGQSRADWMVDYLEELGRALRSGGEDY